MHLARSGFSPRQPLLYTAYTLGTVPGCCDIYCDQCPIFQSLFQSFHLYILLPRNAVCTTREAREGGMRAHRGGADTRQTNETQESPGSDD